MVFVDANGVVRNVAAKVPIVPLDTPDGNIPRRGGVAKYVLELPAGEAQHDGIVPGKKLLLPLPAPSPQPNSSSPGLTD